MKKTKKLESLFYDYKKKEFEIKKRLKSFKEKYQSNNKEIFKELVFCILTPQSKALYCDRAVERLKRTGLLYKGTKAQIKKELIGVRFPNNKASYIIVARETFTNGKLKIKERLDPEKIFKTRQWLVKNVKGIGYKEASHFLRNIGLGENIAILDRHILSSLKEYGAIREIPANINKEKYINIEDRFRKFSKKINITMGELDLLFWYRKTGMIFK